MMETHILEYLSCNRSFQTLKEFIDTCCGLELFLLDDHGELVLASEGVVHLSRTIISPGPGAGEDLFDGPQQKELLVDEAHLDDVLNSKKPKIAALAPYGNKQLIVPLLVRDQVVGILLLEEDKPSRRSDENYHAIIRFISDFVRRLIKAESIYDGFFQEKDLTPQKLHIKKVLDYVHQNYWMADLSLRKIASLENVSYWYLSFLFKKEIHINFIQYLKKFRIKKAKELLKKKCMSVGQVAHSCGFEDPGYFSRAFKLNTGKTPAFYRNNDIHEVKKSGSGRRFLACWMILFQVASLLPN